MDLPAEVRPLLDGFVGELRALLADNLIGIYLHGSLAMGEFNPLTSDVDVLVVVRDPLGLDAKRAVVALTLKLAPLAPSKGLEFSIVLLRHTQRVAHPTPFEFHASPYWYDALRTGAVDLMAPGEDPDLAAHFVITKARGVCLTGEPIDEVFGEVPEAAYWSSISEDARSILDDLAGDPVYGILNLCRVMAYQRDRLVTSKREGGRWALEHLEPRFHDLVHSALEASQSGAPFLPVPDSDLTAFAEYARARLSL